MPFIAIAVVAVLAVGGGVSVAAENALPGQALYPVKVHVDENIEGAFALTDSARATWDMQAIAQRLDDENIEGAFALTDSARATWDMQAIAQRLDEAQQLASQDQLSLSAQADITNNFDTHLYDIGTIINKLKAAGDTADADAIDTKFKAMLAGREEILASSSVAVSGSAEQSLVPVVAELQGALGAAAVLSSSTVMTQMAPSAK